MIANLGADEAEKWAANVMNNFARSPQGNDRDQVKAILAGEGNLAIINTYYLEIDQFQQMNLNPVQEMQ